MSSNAIITAAPLTNLLGTQDVSTRQVPREPEAIPTHLPKCFIWGQRGPTSPQLVSGNELAAMYGADTFDERKKWANHATTYLNKLNAEGNALMVERLVPPDAGPQANLLLSADVLATDVPDYLRNSDGSIKRDATTNQPVPSGTSAAGFKVIWKLTYESTVQGLQDHFGAAQITQGTQTAGATHSQNYPILHMKVSSVGSDGNNVGIRLWTPTSTTIGQYDTRILTRDRVLPIRLSVIRRDSATGSAKIANTLTGEQSILATLKPGVISQVTQDLFDLPSVFTKAYSNLNDPLYPKVYGDFSDVHVYDDNVVTLLAMFYQAEKAFNDTYVGAGLKTDFSTTVGAVQGEEYLFNMFTGQSSQAYPYHTFQVVNGAGSVVLGPYTNLYANGSSDGTLSDANYEAALVSRMADYADPNSDLQNTAVNVESILYDTGVSLDTKYALTNFIAERRDTFVWLSTYEAAGGIKSVSEDNALAVALRTRLEMNPESEYFGTHVMRGGVMGRSCLLRSSQYKGRVSPLVEVAIKSAQYMGASNGVWKNGKNFDGAPGSILTNTYDLKPSYTPASVRNKDWDAGLNWAQDYDRSSTFFPALRTVYNDDTSVLNSYFTAMIIVEVNKVCERAWRYFSGVSNLSDEQLAERVDRFIVANTSNRFDGRVAITPTTYYTDADTARGYSWTTKVEIYAPSLKTVMTAYVQARRLSDLTTA